MILGIIDKLNEWVEPAKAFVENNHSNPILWVALFLIGLAVFALTYGALNKNQ